MIERHAHHQETGTTLAPADRADHADGPVPTEAPAETAPLDLRALAVHFPGYEIVDPVTVVLRPVTIATPRGARGGGTG